MKPIWIVDDDQSIRFVLEKALAREQLAVRSFSTPRDVLAALESDEPQVLVSDIRMPGGSGIDLLAKVKARLPALPCQSFGQYLAHMVQAPLTIFAQSCQSHFILHQRPHGGHMIVAGQGEHIGQRQAAPRCTQNRQPIHPVSAMVQCARQSDQILHHLPFRQRFQIDGNETPRHLLFRW